jgi:excisionase family DNA binding protein
LKSTITAPEKSGRFSQAANAECFTAADIDDIPDQNTDAQKWNADGLEIVTVTEPILDADGIVLATWERRVVFWETKGGAPWVFHESDPEPTPELEAHPDLVEQATAILTAAQKDAATRVMGRKPDANVARTASGRKSRSRRAVLSNEEALGLIRHHHGDMLDVLHAADAITATQHTIGQALQRDIHEADRCALLLTKPPRSDEGDMRSYVSGDSTNTGVFEDDGKLEFTRDYGSTGTPGIRELDQSLERRRLDAAFVAVLTRLQGGATGWAVVSGPHAPGPRWRLLAGANRTIARRLPHPAHVWPNLGTPMLPLTPTTHLVRRSPAPRECTRQTWRWLCSVATSAADGERWVRCQDVARLRQWLDVLAPIYAPIVTGSARQEAATVPVSQYAGTKLAPRDIRVAQLTTSPSACLAPPSPAVGGGAGQVFLTQHCCKETQAETSMTYFTPAQAAAMANVSIRTLQYEVERGNLRRIKLGRSVRFSETDMQDWIQNGRA